MQTQPIESTSSEEAPSVTPLQTTPASAQVEATPEITPQKETPTPPKPPELAAEVKERLSSLSNLDKFMFYMEDMECPDHFLHWNYFFMISSCLGRKVWLRALDSSPCFPNLFLIYVADPGIGKSMPANKCISILNALMGYKENRDGSRSIVPLVNIAPTSVTLESLWDIFKDSIERTKISDNPERYYIHHSVSCCLGDELGLLLRKDTFDLVKFLESSWDCGNFRRKIKSEKEINLHNICLNLLGCCTPDWMARNIKTSLFSEGLGARVIFLYADKPRKRTVEYGVNSEKRFCLGLLIKHLATIASLKPSELQKSDAARAWWTDFVLNRLDTRKRNEDKKLKNFYGRFRHHLEKLAIIVHFSEKTNPIIDDEDFEEALRRLETIEMNMHKALLGTSENPVYSLAENIKKSIKNESSGSLTSKGILLRHFEDLPDAEENIAKAINYLLNVGEIVAFSNEKGVNYKLT